VCIPPVPDWLSTRFSELDAKRDAVLASYAAEGGYTWTAGDGFGADR
jgi:hypothetical protein